MAVLWWRREWWGGACFRLAEEQPSDTRSKRARVLQNCSIENSNPLKLGGNQHLEYHVRHLFLLQITRIREIQSPLLKSSEILNFPKIMKS